MRNRWDITPQYLNQLIDKIGAHANNYENYRQTLWLHRDEHMPEYFAKFSELKEKISTLKAPASPSQPEQIAATDDITKLTLKEIMENQPAADHHCLELYHDILRQLFFCYQQSEHKDHLTSLYNLLLTELKSQTEAEWRNPDDDCTEQACIKQALQNLENHAGYISTNEKLYAERWCIDDSLLQSLKDHIKATGADLKWDQMRLDQSWHIQRNDQHEINTAAKYILGLTGDHKADCFVLQKKNAEIREMETKLRELQSKKSKQELAHRKEMDKLRERRKKNPELAPEIVKKEKEFKATSSYQDLLIKEQTREIHEALIALMLDTSKQESNKNSLQRLHDHARELSLWNTRNLSILLIDNLLDAQIRIMKQLTSTTHTDAQEQEAKLYELEDTKKTGLNIMIESLSKELQHILEHVREAEDKVAAELSELKKIADAQLVNMHHLEPFTIARTKTSPQQEAEDFKAYAKQHLSELTTLEHFETAKALRTYEQTFRFGALLPRAKDVLQYQPPAPAKAAPDTTETPVASGLRRSLRVASGLSHITSLPTKSESAPANTSTPFADKDKDDDSDHEETEDREDAPLIASNSPSRTRALPPPSSSLGKNILFGIAVGFSIALIVAGITAAVIFSGGTVLAAGVLAGIFGGIFAGGIIGGFIGGAVYSCCTGSKANHTTSPITPARTNNAGLFSRLGGANGFTVTEQAVCAPLPASAKSDAGALVSTAQQPSVSPTFRSPGM